MDLKKTLIITVMLSAISLGGWELFWRSQGKVPTIQDDKDLWAVQRARVKDLTENDFIFVGSSRVLFDLQLDKWEELTGRRPLQLAHVGASPLPSFRDLVRNSDFAGTIVVGVTPPLFFSTTFPKAPPISGMQVKVDYFHNRTLAQRFNHWLSLPLQRNFAMVHSYEDLLAGNFDLRSLLQEIRIGNRTGAPQMPPFYEFGETAEDRNVRMIDRMVKEPEFAQTVTKVWMFCMRDAGPLPPPDKEGTIAFFAEDVEIFQKRGGKVVLLRCPSSNDFRAIEAQMTPRSGFWDELVKRTGVKGYHFEDYKQLQGHQIPEWSHLSAESADVFTAELVGIMKKDGLITNPPNQ
jgi:hypothetical protein